MMAFYLINTLVAMVIGLSLTNLIRPGVGASLYEPSTAATPPPKKSISELLLDLVPRSIGEPFTQNHLAQLVLLTLALGVGLVGEFVRARSSAGKTHPFKVMEDLLTIGFGLLMKVLLWVVTHLVIALGSQDGGGASQCGSPRKRNIHTYIIDGGLIHMVILWVCPPTITFLDLWDLVQIIIPFPRSLRQRLDLMSIPAQAGTGRQPFRQPAIAGATWMLGLEQLQHHQLDAAGPSPGSPLLPANILGTHPSDRPGGVQQHDHHVGRWIHPADWWCRLTLSSHGPIRRVPICTQLIHLDKSKQSECRRHHSGACSTRVLRTGMAAMAKVSRLGRFGDRNGVGALAGGVNRAHDSPRMGAKRRSLVA